MASVIPNSNSVVESAVINAPLAHIWDYLKLESFSSFYDGISKSEFVKGTSEGANIVKWTFKDGIVLEVKQEEYSAINHYISFSIISCHPYKLPYTSVLSTIRLYAITSGSAEGSTFVQWSGHYSSDAIAEVVQDGKIKRREALANLAKAAEKK